MRSLTYLRTPANPQEKQRVLAAIDAKIAGKQIVSPEPTELSPTGQVIDLMEALKKSLAAGKKPAAAKSAASAGAPRKSAKRAATVAPIAKRTAKKG